ncbi:hypothetical protein EYF80_046163 [Liparis tanakae]|uniref:Uncharacterized protein n=1 Tax=Liparis tanakae TaxID=230148 RepID=A0A4Z2FR40_9TELE|nr:hypothetical protein EYF80_046163 [Liparis tanakae]
MADTMEPKWNQDGQHNGTKMADTMNIVLSTGFVTDGRFGRRPRHGEDNGEDEMKISMNTSGSR